MADFITVNASKMESFDYTTYFAEYYADLGTTQGTASYYGSENYPPFGYYNGTQVGIRFAGSENDAQIVMQGDNLQYDGIVNKHGSYSGSVDSIVFGRYDENTTYTETDEARSELSGVIKELLVKGLDIEEQVGAGTGADNDFYGLMNALRRGNVTPDALESLYDYFGSKAQFFKGSAGSDTYVGTEFADKIQGGKGLDHLDGAGGEDIFIFRKGDSSNSAHAADIIHNFVSGEDSLNFRKIDADIHAKGNQDFDFIGTDKFSGDGAEVRYQRESDYTYVYLDTDGNGRTDYAVRLEGSMKLTADDFML